MQWCAAAFCSSFRQGHNWRGSQGFVRRGLKFGRNHYRSLNVTFCRRKMLRYGDLRNESAGHRRLLEHLSDPACPSIRRFVETFPATKNGSENGSEKIIAECGVEKNRSKNGLVMGCSSGHAKRPGESLTSNGPENGSDNRFTIGAVNGAVSNGSADVLGQDGSGLAVGGYGHGSSARTASREELQRLQMRRDSSEDGSGGARSNSEADALREAYNGCLNALYEFR